MTLAPGATVGRYQILAPLGQGGMATVPAREASVGATLAADIRQRPLLAAGLAAGALVMVGAGAAMALGVFAGSQAAPLSAAGPSPRTTSTLTSATIPKGALYWEAKLDGTDGDIQGGSLRKGSAVMPIATNNADDAAVLRPQPGALELVTQQPGGAIGFSFNSTPRRSYIAEFDIAFSQDTKIISNWTVRTGTGQDGRQTFYVLRLVPSIEQAYFISFSRGAQAQPLSASAKVPGLGSGRQFTITLVVEDARVTLFVDGKSVTEFADDKMPTTLTRPFVSVIGDSGGTASFGSHGPTSSRSREDEPEMTLARRSPSPRAPPAVPLAGADRPLPDELERRGNGARGDRHDRPVNVTTAEQA